MVSHAASTRGKPQGAVASWLRNLFRPGLRPNGTSNNARHRETRPQRQRPAPLDCAALLHHPSHWRRKVASSERIVLCPCLQQVAGKSTVYLLLREEKAASSEEA